MSKSTDPSTPKFPNPQAPTQEGSLLERALWQFGFKTKKKPGTTMVSKDELGLEVATGTGTGSDAHDGDTGNER